MSVAFADHLLKARQPGQAAEDISQAVVRVVREATKDYSKASNNSPWDPASGNALLNARLKPSFVLAGLPIPIVFQRWATRCFTKSTGGQVIAYFRGMRPATDYTAKGRPRITRRQFRGTVLRTIGNLTAALVCSAFVHHLAHPWYFALRVGLVTGLVTGIGITLTPFIEYYADHLPERRLGAFGIGLILYGFTLQSIQYWLALFDVRLRCMPWPGQTSRASN